jgi:hypothetical protein
MSYESGRVIDIGIGYGQQEIYVSSIPVFLADLPEKRLLGSRPASHGCEDIRKSSGLTNRFIKKRSSISNRKMSKKLIQELYPFYTRWAIAFWYVLY